MKSSYLKNDYGSILSSLVKIHQPQCCVELGCLEGYSTVNIARSLKDNNVGHLTVIDLFEDYKYNNCNRDKFINNLKSNGVNDFCTIIDGNAFTEYRRFSDNSVNFLHIDISNDGDILEKVFRVWDKKLDAEAIFVFEGGSKERDNIDWMIKYKKPAIRNFIFSDYFFNYFDFFIFEPYPSMTVCRKKSKQKNRISNKS